MASRLPAQLRPRLVNNKWMAPAIRPRMANRLRKEAIVAGTFAHGADLEQGGWDPAWDSANKAVVMREPKGRKYMRNRPARVAKIEAAMATMDERIAEMYEERIAKQPVSFYEKQFIAAGYLKTTPLTAKERKKATKAK
mmetsp:Transcript_11209/g.31797  ORF Transcript_11209/g.31797 Transcript_11209/m.31797 type:complete len:139 (+) Transcript_11209:129-545(+)